jgi:hypothetical protein
MSTNDTVDHGRRALLGAAGALILQGVLEPTTASGQTASGSKLKIGVIGAGHIGGTIGELWTKAGHPVFFSSRHPEELKDIVERLGSLAQAGTVDQAIAFGDVVFIAVPYGALPQIGKDYGKSLAGKIVLDADNAVAARDGAIADEVERDGVGVTSQKYLPGARVVRAFNTLGYMIFAREATVLFPGLRYQLPAMIRKPCKLRRDWCAMPALIRWRSASWPRRGASSAARQDMARV